MTTENDVDEDNKTLRLTLSLLSGQALAGGALSAVGTIEDDDITVGISSSTTSYTEGDGTDGRLSFTLTTSEVPPGAGGDFFGVRLVASGAVSFLQAGDRPPATIHVVTTIGEFGGTTTNSAVFVNINHDEVDEADGDLTLALSQVPAGYVIDAANSSFTVAMRDDDDPPPPRDPDHHH